MNIKTDELQLVVAELAMTLPGSFLRKVERVSLEEWVLHLAGASQKYRLMIAVTPTASRLHLLSQPLETGVGLDPFGQKRMSCNWWWQSWR